jgi:hypothetical protein
MVAWPCCFGPVAAAVHQGRSTWMHLKFLEKQEQANPKSTRMKEIIEIRTESKELEIKRRIQQISETKSWFFEKINKIDKPLAKLPKERRRPKLIKSEMKKGIL